MSTRESEEVIDAFRAVTPMAVLPTDPHTLTDSDVRLGQPPVDVTATSTRSGNRRLHDRLRKSSATT